jgi:hypothetical protein
MLMPAAWLEVGARCTAIKLYLAAAEQPLNIGKL